MKANHRLLSLLLALLTAAPAVVGCAEQTVEESVTDAPEIVTEAETADPNDRTQVKDSLPADLDFEGRSIGIYVPSRSANDEFYIGPEEDTGEPVDTAVLERNMMVEDRLKVKLAYEGIDNAWDTIATNISKLVMANDSTYDLFMGQQAGIATLITREFFVNTYDLEYLDYEKPWWNNNYMNELSVGEDHRFFMVGDLFFEVLRWTRSIFFNKVLYADYNGDADLMYQEVLDGKWTIDRMNDYIKQFSVDLNSNNRTDIEDQLGFCTYATSSSVDGFVYGTDIAFTERDSDGFISLTLMSDDAATLAEKLVSLFHQDGSFFGITSDTQNQQTFASGRVLFLGNASLWHAENLRDMEDEYGFLPYPKFDEEQSEYRSLVHDTAFLGAVPVSSLNTDMIGAVIEALNAETYRRVTPAWYETSLKIKYARDMMSTEMIDLIHDSSTTNFIYAYGYALNNIGTMYRGLVSNKSTNVASTVKTLERAAIKKLDKIIDAFTG